MFDVIRKPLITKNTSTPKKPPSKPLKPAWKNITGNTAIALSPFISFLNCKTPYSTNYNIGKAFYTNNKARQGKARQGKARQGKAIIIFQMQESKKPPIKSGFS
jgi:hypothetical protein